MPFELTSDDRRGKNGLHAMFRGSQRRVTAPDDPVLEVKFPRATHHLSLVSPKNEPSQGQ